MKRAFLYFHNVNLMPFRNNDDYFYEIFSILQNFTHFLFHNNNGSFCVYLYIQELDDFDEDFFNLNFITNYYFIHLINLIILDLNRYLNKKDIIQELNFHC
jgi:hypothetical protein